MAELCKAHSHSLMLEIIKKINVDIKNSSKSNLDENKLTSTSRNKIARLITKLNKKTHFNDMQLTIICKLFHVLNDSSDRKLLPDYAYQQFLHVNLGITDTIALAGITRAVKKNPNKKGLLIKEFIMSLNVLLRGSIEEKCYLAFQIIDYNHDGLLHKNQEIANLMRNTFFISLAEQKDGQDDSFESEREMADYIWKKFKDNRSPIDYECFKKMILREPIFLESLVKFLPDPSLSMTLQTLLFSNVKL